MRVSAQELALTSGAKLNGDDRASGDACFRQVSPKWLHPCSGIGALAGGRTGGALGDAAGVGMEAATVAVWMVEPWLNQLEMLSKASLASQWEQLWNQSRNCSR